MPKPALFELDWQQTYTVPVPNDAMAPRAEVGETYYVTRQLPLTHMLTAPQPVLADDLGVSDHATVAVTRKGEEQPSVFGFLVAIGGGNLWLRMPSSPIDWGIPTANVERVEWVAGVMSRVDIPGAPALETEAVA